MKKYRELPGAWAGLLIGWLAFVLSCSSDAVPLLENQVKECQAKLESFHVEADRCAQEKARVAERLRQLTEEVLPRAEPAIEAPVVAAEFELPPPQVAEVTVEQALERYALAVKAQIEGLQRQVGETGRACGESKEASQAARAGVEEVQSVLSNLSSEQQVSVARELIDLQEELAGREKMLNTLVERVAAVNRQVHRFNQERVLCEDCRGRLKLRDSTREELALFNGSVLAMLSEISAEAARQ